MGELKDKIVGHTNEVIGKAKRAIGAETNDPNLVDEGNVQEAKGDVQKAVGSLKGALGNKV
jgi:uncharacterized protein YjbJ (UPF0337 family)